MGRTLYDKIWDDHLVANNPDGTSLIYIDRHLVHEVTSPQAFEGLRASGRKVHAPEKTLAVVDHNIPTTDRSKPNPDPESIEQMRVMAENAKEFGIEYYNEFDKRQGIVHVIGPEQGFTLPGTTIVCGDSHTSTHGAFGALAHGIGTSEVEHVLATQTLIQKKAKNMRAVVDGKLPDGALFFDATGKTVSPAYAASPFAPLGGAISSTVAEAAAAQGRFWPMHDRLFQHQMRLDSESLMDHARALGLDLAKFRTHLQGPEAEARVREDLSSGNASEVRGTPSLFINGERYDGPRDRRSLIDALARAAVVPAQGVK